MSNLRKTGQSTRIIDKAIQEFFTDGETDLADHIPTQKMRDWIVRRFLNRLYTEHGVTRHDIYLSLKDGYTFIKYINKKEYDASNT